MLRGAVKVAILAIVVYKLVGTALNFGVHLHYKKHHPGDCSQVKGLDFGSEDLQVTRDGLAFITSGLSYPPMATGYTEFLKSNKIKGNIYLYDFNKPDLGARKLQLKLSKDFNPDTFRPHGISLLEDETHGEHLIYIINHREGADDAVEKFRYLPKTNELVHLKSISSDKLHITNDLAVNGEDKFYITNFLYFKNQQLSLLEQVILPFGLGSLLFFNGTDFTVMEKWMHSPNGIFLSKDKRYLYVSMCPLRSVDVYEVKADTSLVLLQSVPLHTMTDNLHLSQSGDILYTGTHPILHKIVPHVHDPTLAAPSSVLSLPLKDGKVVLEDITELFYDHGDLISGSSVAAVYNNKLLIGSIINKLVICEVKIKI